MEVRAAVTVDDKGAVQPAGSDDKQVMYEYNRGGLFVLLDGNKPVTKTAGEILPNPVVNRPVEALEE